MVPSGQLLPPIYIGTALQRISDPGKRGRVVNAVDSLTAHISDIEEHIKPVPICVESALGDNNLDSAACTPPTELKPVDLYAVGSEEPEEFKIDPLPEVPFVHGIAAHGPCGSVV